MIQRHVVALASVAVACGQLGWAQAPSPKAESAARMRKDLFYIASDELQGRGLATDGIKLAAEHISKNFADVGVKPAIKNAETGEMSYYQPFTFRTAARLQSEKSAVTITSADGTITIKPGNTMTVVDAPRAAGSAAAQNGYTNSFKGELVFAGYGISAPDLSYDDYAGLDVKGKVVMVVRREPQQDNATSVFNGKEVSNYASIRNKAETAKKLGAVGMILVNDPFTNNKNKNDEFATSNPLGGLPCVQISASIADQILARTNVQSLAKFESKVDADLKPMSAAIAGCSVVVSLSYEQVQPFNVVGVLEGEGPFKDETIVLGAHYDHLGFGGSGSLKPGSREIHNGADDNGSGTTLLMEMARRFGTRGTKPARRLVFIAFSAEESGLVGSARYCENPAFPLKTTFAMVNFDMVGRLKDNKLVVNGVSSAAEFPGIVETCNKELGLTITQDKTVDDRSDHASFIRKGVPAIFFFTGLHDDYHRPSDDPDKINYDGMASIADLAEKAVDNLLARDKALTFQARNQGAERRTQMLKAAKEKAQINKDEKKAESKPSAPKTAENKPMTKEDVAKAHNENDATTLAGAPYLGTRPNYTDSSDEGVLLDGTTGGSPAEKAGIKAGDILLKIGDNRFNDLQGMMTAMKKFKAGQATTLTVKRGGKEVVLNVTFGTKEQQ